MRTLLAFGFPDYLDRSAASGFHYTGNRKRKTRKNSHSLFDGKTLKGWEGKKKFFRVQDGAIVAGFLNARIPNNEFLASEKEYADFELRFEAKLVGQGNNAGVQFRSQRIPKTHEMIGYQCDIGGWSKGTIWGFLYDESRRRKMLAEAPQDELKKHVKPKGEWNKLVVRAEGPRIQIWLNDYQTVDFTESGKRHSSQRTSRTPSSWRPPPRMPLPKPADKDIVSSSLWPQPVVTTCVHPNFERVSFHADIDTRKY